MSVLDVVASGDPERERMEDVLVAGAFPARDEAGGSDAWLVEAAKSDPNAFGELYERFYARVYRYVYHRVGHNADAEDLTAVIFMKALEALSSYQSRRAGFAPWLFRIARNAVIDHYRRQRRQTSLEVAEAFATGSDPEGHAIEREVRSELRAMVGCLSDDQRDVVLLRYGADLTYPEIAEALGKQEAAVRMLLHRGLRRLKTVMGDE